MFYIITGTIFPIASMLLICSLSVINIVFAFMLLILMMSVFGSNLPAFLVAQFHKNRRYSGMGISYNIAQGNQNIVIQHLDQILYEIGCDTTNSFSIFD